MLVTARKQQPLSMSNKLLIFSALPHAYDFTSGVIDGTSWFCFSL